MSSHNMKNPTGGGEMPHVIEMPDPNGNLLERILSRENMRMAWKRVKTNRGAPADSGVTIREFSATIRDSWDDIRKSLMGSSCSYILRKRVLHRVVS